MSKEEFPLPSGESYVWEPTMNLRWIKKEKFVHPGGIVKYKKTLQQMWLGNMGGQTEWRDIQSGI